ncbi:hypothetical protein BKA65DRAFT_214479 [Rhexocercosporidium sp. MPI-PUGE-AT-0058]|nr:hypothetical protein BKA65DRAFT_214479 [Rhexocercosporidium sp. MPI-PUGE-AT-0058]
MASPVPTTTEDDINEPAINKPYKSVRDFIEGRRLREPDHPNIQWSEISDLVDSHADPDLGGLNEDGILWLKEYTYWKALFPNEAFLNKEFPCVRTYYPHRELDPSYNNPHKCQRCALNGWEVGDTRCPYVDWNECYNGCHPPFPFRIGMEVNTMPICPACHRTPRSFLSNEWDVVERRESIVKQEAEAAQIMRIDSGKDGEDDEDETEETATWVGKLKKKVTFACNTLRRRKRQ